MPVLDPYLYPRSVPRSERFTVTVDGEPHDVLHTAAADFVVWEGPGPFDVVVTSRSPLGTATLRPRQRALSVELEKKSVARFRLPGPMNVAFEPESGLPLFIFANPPESEAAEAAGNAAVHRFRAGQIHEVGEFKLGPGERMHIEGGAVVRGCVRGVEAHGATISGRGVFDGGFYTAREHRRSIVMEHARGVRISDIVMIQPSAWMLVLGGCEDVNVRNIKQIGEVVSSDGIDVVGSRNVHVSGCFLRNNDDCVAVKAVDYSHRTHDAYRTWEQPVENVLVEQCVFVNDRAGNATEIGFETRTDSIRNVVFRDCDILSVHGHGAAFSIHNGDRATVEDVVWDNIRVEHHYDKLIDLRVLWARYSRDAERGHVRNVTLRDIQVFPSPFNAGYTVSLIGGLDAEHRVDKVRIENLTYDGRRITGPDEIDLYCKHASEVTFQ